MDQIDINFSLWHSAFIMLGLIGALLNALITISIVKHKELQTKCHFLLANIRVTDSFFSILLMLRAITAQIFNSHVKSLQYWSQWCRIWQFAFNSTLILAV